MQDARNGERCYTRAVFSQQRATATRSTRNE
jgi:hypothetical protein